MLMLYGYVWWNKKKHILRYWHNIYNNPPHGLVIISISCSPFQTFFFFSFIKIIIFSFHDNFLFIIYRSDGTQMVPMRENPLYLMRDSYVSVTRLNLFSLSYLHLIFSFAIRRVKMTLTFRHLA